jgi:hypothetical protein
MVHTDISILPEAEMLLPLSVPALHPHPQLRRGHPLSVPALHPHPQLHRGQSAARNNPGNAR